MPPDQYTRLVELVFPQQTNHYGTLYGGAGLYYMDKAAFIAGSRFSRRPMVTASSEKIDFHAPAKLGQIVELIARPISSGRKSVKVEVDLVAEDLLNGNRILCTRGKFTLVAMDKPDPEPGMPKLEIAPDSGSEEYLKPSHETRIVEMVFPGETNHYGTLYGGEALSWMGKAAFVAATRYSRKVVMMAASERVDFREPVQQGALVETIARVVSTGNTSMTVAVDMFSEDLQSGERKLCTQGIFIMAGLDSNKKPVSVPPLKQA